MENHVYSILATLVQNTHTPHNRHKMHNRETEPWMPSLENWGGRLSVLWAQLSLHIQSLNLLTTNTEQQMFNLKFFSYISPCDDTRIFTFSNKAKITFRFYLHFACFFNHGTRHMCTTHHYSFHDNLA